MDLDQDGAIDILSGSYSRHDRDMAGLFQVLWGVGKDGKRKKAPPKFSLVPRFISEWGNKKERKQEKGGAPATQPVFQAAMALTGTDGKPLIITAEGEQGMTDKICTRPTAVDLDGDGHLDIVSGNFAGTFALFKGEGKGRFAPRHEWLKSTNGERLSVPMHGDPFFVDWDGDGDLDMISGSGSGGVFLFVNAGSKTAPKFEPAAELVPAAGHDAEVAFGRDHVKGPGSSTRVWAGDIDGDGKLDLLIGDSVDLHFPATGLTEAAAGKKLEEWKQKNAALSKVVEVADGQPTKAQMNDYTKKWQKLWAERSEFMTEKSTGFVWILYRK